MISAHLTAFMSRLSSRSVKLAAAALLAAVLPSVAHAGDSRVYGSEYALNNDYNAAGQIGCSFGSGSSPNLTAWFNFSSSNLWGYPAAIRGYHYGFNPAGDTLFPFQVSSKSSIPCAFSYSQGGSSMQGDFAYDMFLRWDNSVTYPNCNPQCEVMVWGDHNSFPIGNCTATSAVYAANRWFDLWEGYNSAAGYYVYTFVPTGSVKWPVGTLPSSGSLNVDMKAFFNWLQNNRSGSGYYNSNMYLDVVEAGFEIVTGNGWVWVQGDINATTGGGGGVSNGTYKIISQQSGLAMETWNQGTGNGTQIDQYYYWGGSGQKWTVTNRGSWYSIIGVQSGKSIDIYNWGTANDTKVGLWDFGGGTNQQFTFSDQGGGQYRITPACATGSCLDVDQSTSAAGAKVHLWQWVGAAQQKWSLQTP